MARRKLSDSIVEDFLRRIGSGDLQPGTHVPPETALCTTYGVGRSVIREALRGLAAKGFLNVRQGTATTIAPRHRWQVLDRDFLSFTSGEEFFDQLQEARELIEPRLAGLAAARGDRATIAALEAVTDRLVAAGTAVDEHATLDLEFHELVATASGNAILASLHRSITNLGYRTRIASADLPGAVDRAIFWHRHILEAIRTHDADAAEASMRMHLRQVRSELQALSIRDGDVARNRPTRSTHDPMKG